MNRIERFADPKTGAILLRRSLGHTWRGRLYLRPSPRSAGTDLYFFGSLKDIDLALNFDLQRTIVAAWGKLYRQHDHVPDVTPVCIAINRFWLCRLPHGQYKVAELPRGGFELFQIEPDPTSPPRAEPARPPRPIIFDDAPGK